MGGEAALSVKRTHLLNYITRNGARVGNTFGTIALIYSALGVGLSLLQEENDELNTALAATTTGTLYGALSGAKAAEGLTGNNSGEQFSLTNKCVANFCVFVFFTIFFNRLCNDSFSREARRFRPGRWHDCLGGAHLCNEPGKVCLV